MHTGPAELTQTRLTPYVREMSEMYAVEAGNSKLAGSLVAFVYIE
jgi:hypothetical protein